MMLKLRDHYLLPYIGSRPILVDALALLSEAIGEKDYLLKFG